MHTLKRVVTIDTTLKEAWDFISRPENLNLITPDDLNFTIVSDVPDKMYNGLLIEYIVRIPLIGSQRWLTEIKHIRPGHSFVDEQRIGPYKLWYHYHQIEQVKDGVVFVDEVTYAVPYSILGRLVNRFFIGRTLERIFDFRTERFKELLSGMSSRSAADKKIKKLKPLICPKRN